MLPIIGVAIGGGILVLVAFVATGRIPGIDSGAGGHGGSPFGGPGKGAGLSAPLRGGLVQNSSGNFVPRTQLPHTPEAPPLPAQAQRGLSFAQSHATQENFVWQPTPDIAALPGYETAAPGKESIDYSDVLKSPQAVDPLAQNAVEVPQPSLAGAYHDSTPGYVASDRGIALSASEIAAGAQWQPTPAPKG